MSERRAEEEGWTEIGRVHVVTMQHVDPAETETVTKVGVNEEPTFRAATLSKKVAGVTVRILEKVDNTVREGSSIQFASKAVKQVQVSEGKEGGAPMIERKVTPAPTPAPAEGEKPSLLKNMVDKIQDRLNAELPTLHFHDKIAYALGGLGVAGLIVAVVAIVKLLIH